MMTGRIVRGVLVAAALLAAVPLAPRAAGRRPIADTDLLDFVWLADPRLSPDRQYVAFVRVVADRGKDRYDSSVWVVLSIEVALLRTTTVAFGTTAPLESVTVPCTVAVDWAIAVVQNIPIVKTSNVRKSPILLLSIL